MVSPLRSDRAAPNAMYSPATSAHPARWATRNRALALGSVLLVGAAWVAWPSPGHAQRASGLDRSGQYALEVRACNEARTAEDRATCLREARNAQADRKRGQLDRGGDFQANALARCNALQGDDRRACEMRMRGEGRVSGSVEGGGVLREVEAVVSPPPDSAARTASPVPDTPPTTSMCSGPTRPVERPDTGATPQRPAGPGAAGGATEEDDDDDEESDTPSSGATGTSGSGS